MTDAVETRLLTRSFGPHLAVDRVSLRVPQGRIFGYLGLNGAGKSTTIKMLATLLPPTSGSARVMGHDVVAEPLAVRRLIGLVGDDGGESRPSWSAREFVSYFAGLQGLPDRKARVEAVLGAVGLEEAWRRRPMGAYSTGMKRRAELARALLGEPRVLFLDEPTRGLDLPAKRQVWELLRGLSRQGVTVFVSSHEVAEILALCEDLAVIAKGRLSHCGPTGALGREPEEFERRLIPLLEGARRETSFTVVKPGA